MDLSPARWGKESISFPPPSSLLESRLSVSPLSFAQNQVDGAVGSFIHQSTDWKCLAAMAAGGTAYRLGRLGVLSAGAGPTGFTASLLGGLLSEVTTFELTNRALISETPNLWRWSGSHGLQTGFFSSFVTFGTLKGFGGLTQGQNTVFQHTAQAAGMVLGHQAAYRLGWGPKPEGSVLDQFLLAEATNLQLAAGAALGHALTGGRFWVMERGMGLSLPSFDPVGTQRSEGVEKAVWGETRERSPVVNGVGLLAMAAAPGRGSGFFENVRHLVSGIFKKEPIQRKAPDPETLRKKAETYKAQAYEKTAKGYQPVMVARSSRLPDAQPLRVRYERISEIFFDADPSREYFQLKWVGPSPPVKVSLIDAIRMGLFDLGPDRSTRRNFSLEGLYVGEWTETRKADRHAAPTSRVFKAESFLENGVLAQELPTGYPLLFFPVKEEKKFHHPKGEIYQVRSAQILTFSSAPQVEITLVGEESSLSRTVRLEAANAMDLGWASLNDSGRLIASLEGKRAWLTPISSRALLQLGGQTISPTLVMGEKEASLLALPGELFGERLPDGRVLLSRLPLGPYSALKDLQTLTVEQFLRFGFPLEDLERDDAPRIPFAQGINWDAVKVAAQGGIRITDLRNSFSPFWIMRVGIMDREIRKLRRLKGEFLQLGPASPKDAPVRIPPPNPSAGKFHIDARLAHELGPGTFFAVREKEEE